MGEAVAFVLTVISTPRLLLRPVLPEDLMALWEAAHSDVPRWMYWQPPGSLSTLRVQLRTETVGGKSFPLVIARERNLIGRVFLVWRKRWEIGFWLLPEYRGKGYAKEAAEGVIRHAFAALNVKEIYATCVPDNAASRKVILSLGMTYVRTVPGGFIKDGKEYDSEEYRLSAP